MGERVVVMRRAMQRAQLWLTASQSQSYLLPANAHAAYREKDAFLYRPKQRKSWVHLQNWLFFCHYIPIVSTAKPWPLGLLSDCYRTWDSPGREGWRRQDRGRSREKKTSFSFTLPMWELNRLWDVLNMIVGFSYRVFQIVTFSAWIICSLWWLMASWLCKDSFREAIVGSLYFGAAAACSVCYQV